MVAFEFGNVAVALLMLRSIKVLTPGEGLRGAIVTCVSLYVLYNAVSVGAAVMARRHRGRIRSAADLSGGTALFLLAYFAFALSSNPVVLALAFAGSGAGLGLVRAAERQLVVELLPVDSHIGAFKALSLAQMVGNMSACALTGILWSAVSVQAALMYLGTWLALALLGTLIAVRPRARREERGTSEI
jgi:hypothetical protein